MEPVTILTVVTRARAALVGPGPIARGILTSAPRSPATTAVRAWTFRAPTTAPVSVDGQDVCARRISMSARIFPASTKQLARTRRAALRATASQVGQATCATLTSMNVLEYHRAVMMNTAPTLLEAISASRSLQGRM